MFSELACYALKGLNRIAQGQQSATLGAGFYNFLSVPQRGYIKSECKKRSKTRDNFYVAPSGQSVWDDKPQGGAAADPGLSYATPLGY